MSVNIEINKNENLTLHYLPALVKGDGTANVENYFNNYTYEEHGYLRNALRGYPLYGRELNVPDNYQGVVLQETRKPLDDTTERQLKTSGYFDKFHYWNYDKIPTKADHYQQTLQWLTIAEEFSKPVKLEQIEEELSKHAAESNKIVN